MAKSPLLDMIPRTSVDNWKFEWETDVEPTRTYTLAGSSNIDTHATNTTAVFTGSPEIELGTILRNATRATPIGTHQQDELLEVTVNSFSSGTNTCTSGIVRNAGDAYGGTELTGSAVHAETDVFEVVWCPKPEGSAAGVNKYQDVALVENYTNIVDFYLEVTGSQAATKRLVAGDSLQNQFNKGLLKLQNELESMLLYGCINQGASGTAADYEYYGKDTYVRRTKGIDQWLCASGGNIDYTTLDVTEDALNGLFQTIVTNKTDPADKFIIVCHPQNARKISAFGQDKVQIGIEQTKWGRTIDTFKSDLGIQAPVLWTLNCSKSDLFILDLNKVALPVFRPFQKATWTYGDDGTDAWRQRYLGECGVKCVNGIYSHGKIGKISWT